MASINWTMLDAQGDPVPLPDENGILTIDQGVEITLTVPSEATSGVLGSGDKLKETGRLSLTDARLIFLPAPNPKSKSSFESLSIQLHSILSTQFNQPTFGANYFCMELKPAPEGGLTDGTRAEVRFKDKPMFEFVNTLEKARERAVYRKRAANLEDDLPQYSTPQNETTRVEGNASSQTISPAPPGANDPPGYEETERSTSQRM